MTSPGLVRASHPCPPVPKCTGLLKGSTALPQGDDGPMASTGTAAQSPLGKSQESRGGEHVPARFHPEKRATSLFSSRSPIRLQMGVFFHQPNPFKRKGEKKKQWL